MSYDDRYDVSECDCGTCPGCEADKAYDDFYYPVETAEQESEEA